MKSKFWAIASEMVILLANQPHSGISVITTPPAFVAVNARKDLKNPNGNRTQRTNHLNVNVRLPENVIKNFYLNHFYE